jgi:carbamate kinase
MTIDEAKGWLKEGQFPPGSMGPKVQSAIEFLESSTTDARVIIGPLDRATEAVAGQIGTCITKN